MISVVRLNYCLFVSWCGKLTLKIFSVYAPQTGSLVVEKDSFYSALLSNISIVSPDEYLFKCEDFNVHVRKAPEGFNGVHGRCGFNSRNADGIRILVLSAAANLAITNRHFMKPDSHLAT